VADRSELVTDTLAERKEALRQMARQAAKGSDEIAADLERRNERSALFLDPPEREVERLIFDEAQCGLLAEFLGEASQKAYDAAREDIDHLTEHYAKVAKFIYAELAKLRKDNAALRAEIATLREASDDVR
jgi:flagellar motility protein MotE (MotC chaperone)